MSPIVKTVGEFLPHFHHVDLHQFGSPKITSSYIFTNNNHSILFDCGTTDNVRRLLQYLRKANISLESIDYMVPSHHHFDHFYGAFKLYPIVAEKNPNVKVLCTKAIVDRLNDPAPHLERAKRTYGDLVGEIGYLPENAFEIVQPDAKVDVPGWPGYVLQLVATPGHEPEHQSPTIWSPGGEALFCYVGEAAGAQFNSTKPITLPTSMPPGFRFDPFMASLEKLIQIKPQNISFCHFGAVTGAKDSLEALMDQKEFLPKYRIKIKELFEEYRSTRPVVEGMRSFIKERSDFPQGNSVIDSIILAIVYGMLADLGFKER